MGRFRGFTFIEVMIGIVIVSVASYGLMLGAVHARGEMRAIAVEDRALEELLNFMEEMKGKIAGKKLTLVEKAGDQLGRTVYLLGGAHEGYKLPAKIYYDPVVPVYNPEPTSIKRYHLKAWIVWQDYSITAQKATKRLDAETVMLEFPL